MATGINRDGLSCCFRFQLYLLVCIVCFGRIVRRRVSLSFQFSTLINLWIKGSYGRLTQSEFHRTMLSGVNAKRVGIF